jgi:hypothetical protein
LSTLALTGLQFGHGGEAVETREDIARVDVAIPASIRPRR